MSDQTPVPPEGGSELPPEQDPQEIFGYSPQQLTRMGLGFLLEPPREQTAPIKPLSTGLRIDPDEPLEPLEDEPLPPPMEHDLTLYRDPSRLWGYSPKDLKRMGMGSLVPPGYGKKSTLKKEIQPKMETLPRAVFTSPEQRAASGQDTKEIIDPPPQNNDSPNLESRVSAQHKRRKGGQPGNLNALKHGLYLEGARVRNTTPLERAQLFDINHIITCIKAFIDFTYQNGIKSKDLADINETMRSLSLAGMSLTRLISIHDQYISSPLPRDFPTNANRILDVVEYYKKKLAPIVDLSDIDTSYFTDR